MSVIAASPQVQPQVDYDALAKQAGGVDYDALAAQHGGSEATPPSVEGTPDESFHGVKEFGRDLGKTVKGMWDTLTNTPSSEDDQHSGENHTLERVLDMSGTPGLSAGVRAVRGYVEGTQDSIQKARQSAEEGDNAGTALHTAAAALPVVGQMTEGVYDKAKSGDTSGAIGTGLSRSLQLGALGADEPGVTGRVASYPARVPGRLIAKGGGILKDAAVGAEQGLRREPGIVARPVNAVIEGATAAGRRLVPTPNLERMTRTPVGEKFAPVDVKADAASEPNPIDMSAGEISGHPTLQRIQQVGERSLTGGEPVRERIEGAQRAIAARVDNMKEGYASSDKVPDTESAGLAVQKQTQTSMQKLKSSAQTKFDKWLAKAGDIDVDMGDINDKYATKLDKMDEALKGMPSTYAAPIRQLLERARKMGVQELTPEELQQHEFADQIKSQVAPGRLQEVLKAQGLDQLPDLQPGSVKMSSAQMLRSAYSDIANNFTGNVPTQVQHLAGELYHDIDGAMEHSAKTYSQATGKRGIMKGYRDANAEWSQMQTLYNTSGEPLYRTLKATDGQKVMNQLLEPGTSGGSPKNIRVLRDQGVDLGPIQREVLERIHNKNFGIYGKTKLGGYSDPFLKELFGPVGLEELHMLGKQARAVNYNVNPSGTAGVMSATHDLTDVAKAGGQMLRGGLPWYLENPFIKYGAAKLSNNPAFNDWMTNTKGAEVEPGGRTFRPGKGPGAMLAPDSKLQIGNGPKSERVMDTNTVPGNNPTPADIAALKAKHGIPDVPSDKVGGGDDENTISQSILQFDPKTGGYVRVEENPLSPDQQDLARAMSDEAERNAPERNRLLQMEKFNAPADTKGTGGALNAADDAGSATTNREKNKKVLRSRSDQPTNIGPQNDEEALVERADRKVRAHGVDSLTPDEHAALLKAGIINADGDVLDDDIGVRFDKHGKGTPTEKFRKDKDVPRAKKPN